MHLTHILTLSRKFLLRVHEISIGMLEYEILRQQIAECVNLIMNIWDGPGHFDIYGMCHVLFPCDTMADASQVF